MKSKKRIIIIIVLLTIFTTLFYFKTYTIFPENILLVEGEEFTCDYNYPLNLSINANKIGVLSTDNKIVEDKYYENNENKIVLKPDTKGEYNFYLKLFGFIPIKTVNVNVLPKKYVIPCGKTVGVKIFTDGILVIGSSPVTGTDGKKYKPWEKASIKEGDLLLEIDNKVIESSIHLMEIVEESEGKALSVKIKRGEEEIIKNIVPIKSKEENKYKIGLWVRDSTAGIGTVTYFEPENKSFGALGHGISDSQTGNLLTVKEGEIIESKIISVRKGEKGVPGELKGVFLKKEEPIGNININTQSGIFGLLSESDNVNFQYDAIPVASRSQIKEGKAYILSNVESNEVEKYEIIIEKVLRRNELSSKGMIIKIIDKKLLEKTGGIVQGMSGSPIIQENKLIGAVTHVFVNDPSRGYGIFIEWMLNETSTQ